jgi:hypothetical protein
MSDYLCVDAFVVYFVMDWLEVLEIKRVFVIGMDE